jgi:hypothetical protein
VKPVVFLVGADKGGVGKTTIVLTLLDYLPTRGAEARAFDTEFPRGTLDARRHGGPSRATAKASKCGSRALLSKVGGESQPQVNGQTRDILDLITLSALRFATPTSSFVPACLLKFSSARREIAFQSPLMLPGSHATRLNSPFNSFDRASVATAQPVPEMEINQFPGQDHPAATAPAK